MPAETLPGPVGVVSAPWRLPGFHWHVYRRDAVGPAWPTPEERAARLATMPDKPRATPHQVAGWLAYGAAGHGGRAYVWVPEYRTWRCLGALDSQFNRVLD